MKTTTIERLNQIPMSHLRFRDFLVVKSGRDQYSAMRLPTLREAVTEDVIVAVTAALPDDEPMQARCYRWVLRGLHVDKTIRKVKTDAEVSDNAREARTKDKWWIADDSVRAMKEQLDD